MISSLDRVLTLSMLFSLKDTGEFTLELEDPIRVVPWSSVDPYPLHEEIQREFDKFPLYFDGPKPFEVTVKAGEMLYL